MAATGFDGPNLKQRRRARCVRRERRHGDLAPVASIVVGAVQFWAEMAVAERRIDDAALIAQRVGDRDAGKADERHRPVTAATLDGEQAFACRQQQTIAHGSKTPSPSGQPPDSACMT